MKTTMTKLDITISRDEMEVLTKEVNETLAFEHLKHHKTFTSADMWNIQRHRKGILPRRNYR